MSWENARVVLGPVRKASERAASQDFGAKVVPTELDVGGMLEGWIGKR